MRTFRFATAAAAVLLAACSDRQPLAPAAPAPSSPRLAAYQCIAHVREATVTCAPQGAPDGVRALILGGQRQYVNLFTSSVSYDSTTHVFSASVSVTNLLSQSIGTPDGVNADPQGIRVFFHQGPVTTAGTGSVSVANPDGTGSFTASNQPFFRYPGILAPGASTPPKQWRFNVDPGVLGFGFVLFLDVQVQPKLVINEIMAHPTTASEPAGEWFEVYNAGIGAVDLNGWTLASGEGDPGHTISGSVVVPSGGYVVLGGSTDPAANSGTPVNYAYSGVTLGNDALDWLALRTPTGVTIDSVDWGAAPGDTPSPPPTGVARAVASQNFPNTYLSGAHANWVDAVGYYGTSAQRGTPGARNLLPVHAISLAAGASTSCVADDQGQGWCWGSGPSQLGTGVQLAYASSMVGMSMPTKFGKVFAHDADACALDYAGRPWCWGLYFGNPPSLLPNLPSAVLLNLSVAGNSVCGADASGSGYCWWPAYGPPGIQLPALGTITQVAQPCLLASGQVYCLVQNGGTTWHAIPLPGGATAAQIAVTGSTECALSTAGQVYCWHFYDQTVTAVAQPAGVTFTSFSMQEYAARLTTCALTAAGQAYCWGDNTEGRLGNGTTTPSSTPTPVLQPAGVTFSQIAVGGVQTCALQAGTGQVFCWGRNAEGEVGDGTLVSPRLTPVAAGRYDS